MRLLYHLVTPAAWREQPDQPYRAASLATEGFIHCSNADQVAWAANRFYSDAPELLVLVIDADQLRSPVQDEPAGSFGLFPHIYGPIDRSAVLEARALERDASGRWQFAESHP